MRPCDWEFEGPRKLERELCRAFFLTALVFLPDVPRLLDFYTFVTLVLTVEFGIGGAAVARAVARPTPSYAASVGDVSVRRRGTPLFQPIFELIKTSTRSRAFMGASMCFFRYRYTPLVFFGI